MPSLSAEATQPSSARSNSRDAGALVTLVHFEAAFTHVIKPWILPEFESRGENGSISIRWNSRVASIEPEWTAS